MFKMTGKWPVPAIFSALFAVFCLAVGQTQAGTDKVTQADTGKVTQADTGKVTTGGRFILRNHEGKIVTDQDFRGKFLLIYFGYTFCPDICPTSLLVITEALEALDKTQQEKVQPLFITVDPERDTAEVLANYVKLFHPRLIGLTGSKATIASVTRKYRVKFAKVEEGTPSRDSYLMDHTAAIFLMGPDGSYLTRFGHGTKPDAIASKLRQIIGK